MHLSSKPAAIISLLISNMVPLVGALYYGWSSSTIILLYWFESAIIGFFTLQKIKKAEGPVEPNHLNLRVNGKDVTGMSGSFLSSFFLIHYSTFMLVHFVFLLIFFLRFSLNFQGLTLGIVSLIFSHFLSYQQNFLDGKEYLRHSADYFFWSPYPRIISMHLAVVLSGFFILSQGQSITTLAILVLSKTAMDLLSHLYAHRSVK